MKYMPQLPPTMTQRFTDGTPSQRLSQFPPNLAASIPEETQKRMLLWLSQKYIWPQIQERMPYEKMWDKVLEMSRVEIPYDDLFSNTRHDASVIKNKADQANRTHNRVSDSVVHDAIELLTDITYFVSFKEGLPAQFGIPDYIKQPHATKEYRPLSDKIQAGNCLLQWNSGNFKVKRNSLITYRHHYTYGCAFIHSDFRFKVDLINRANNAGQLIPTPELTEMGTSFDPISIRKLWFNWRLPVYDMDNQPCPFFFEETPRFAILQNAYDANTNPFGYLNLDKTFQDQFIYTGPEMTSVRNALASTLKQLSDAGCTSVSQILEPKHSVEARWTLYPMMPFDAKTGEFETRADKTPIPYKRFIIETFGPNIHSGAQILLRLQENYYPKGRLPLYASCHMPDLDSGAYAPSLGQILYNHYKEICLCLEQFLDNKDQLNNSPAWVQTSSPALNVDLNAPGVKIPVNGPNDFGWKQHVDATQTTVAMLQFLKEAAKRTSKATDAVMGEAMGSRTSATEASNAFQASMSAITTDIDNICEDIHGEYAERVWNYSGMWFDPDFLQFITGQFGFAITPEDMWMNLGVITNTGSTFVEKIVKQQNVRYVLETSRGEPGINRANLWEQLLEFMGFDPTPIVDDGGQEQQIQFATEQTCKTYLGYPVLVDPDQDHQIAIRVKTAFIKDQASVWNTNPNYAVNAAMLIKQIEQHQQILLLQQQMMLAQQEMAVARAQLQVHNDNPPQMKPVPNAGAGGQVTQQAGQVAQQGAGAR